MRVLVIDDERLLADTLVLVLQSAGHEACAVYDGAAALSLIGSFQPELIISDVIMIGMNGVELCAAIQAEHPACRILLFSGQADSSSLVRYARQQGYTWEVLAKPISPEILLAKLKAMETGGPLPPG